MKGVILAGGNGTRLRPLTQVINKNMLPVGGRFMLEYPLEAMAKAGIKEVCIISGVEHIGMVIELLKSGKDYGVDITYRVQESPKGIPDAIYQANNFANGDEIMVILGDNVFDIDLIGMVDKSYVGALIVTKEVEHPERFGVVAYDDKGEIVGIVEKPKIAPSKDAVIGIYSYPSDVFEKIETLKPSDRGELEVTDLSNLYLKEGRLGVFKTEGFWIDAGTPEALKEANMWAWSKEGIK